MGDNIDYLKLAKTGLDFVRVEHAKGVEDLDKIVAISWVSAQIATAEALASISESLAVLALTK